MANESLTKILSPATRRSLSDDVTERLRNAILRGQLAPEEPLREAVLSQLLGVSRGPIREALSRLEREGLVVVGPTGRTYVARLSRQDLEEVFSLRKALERLAVEYACRHATPDDINELQVVVNDMARAIERGLTEKEAAELDLRFHDTVYQATRHQRLITHWRTLRPQIYILMLSRNVASADFRDLAVRGHQEILDVIQARDTQRAIDLIDDHMSAGYEIVSRSYALPDMNPA